MLHAMNTLSMACVVEPILWFLVLFSYARFSPQLNCLSFRLYLMTQLAISALSVPLLFLLLSGDGSAVNRLSMLYMRLFWSGTILAGIFAIATLRQILTRLLASLTGIQRIAMVSFQWLLVVAFFITLERMLADSAQATLESELAIFSCGISLVQLVLLVVMVPFTFAVRRSLRSHYQDVMMGLAVLALTSSALGILFHVSGSVAPDAEAVTGHIVLVTTLIFWICCFAGEEKVEYPRMLPIDSKLVLWSEKLRTLDQSSGPTTKR